MYIQTIARRSILFGGLLVLDPKGMIALHERDLMVIATSLMLLVVVPVLVMTAIIAWRYRASNTKAVYTPNWEHDRTEEFIWWAVPSLIIAVLAAITWTSSHTLDPYRPLQSDKPPLVIQVVALNWKWLFLYPEQHIAALNFVQFPVGVPIEFRITSDAPMNSFWIPQLGGQMYAMAGMQTKLHLIANQVGDYSGVSANFSGAGFADMKFTARASAQEDFDSWVATVQKLPDALSSEAYDRLVKPSTNYAPRYFSSVESGLYAGIIHTYMVPQTRSASTAEMRHE